MNLFIFYAEALFIFAFLAPFSLQIFFQVRNGLLCISFVFIEQSYETASYDSSGSMGAGSIESLFVANTETYHAWVVQIHVLNFFEISLFSVVEILLCAGGSC